MHNKKLSKLTKYFSNHNKILKKIFFNDGNPSFVDLETDRIVEDFT